MMTAIDTLVEAGYPPEAVLMELYLSGEMAYSFLKIRELGMLKQHELHSHTSQYGTITPQRALHRPRPAAEAEDAASRWRRSAPVRSPRSGRAIARTSSSCSSRRARCRRACR